MQIIEKVSLSSQNNDMVIVDWYYGMVPYWYWYHTIPHTWLPVVYKECERSTHRDIVTVGEVRYNTFPRYNSVYKIRKESCK